MTATESKRDKVWLLLAALLVLAGLLLAVFAQWLGGCVGLIEKVGGGAVPMKCHWTMIAVKYLGLALAVLAFGQLFLRTKEARRYAAVTIMVVGLVTLILTTSAGIGICADVTMICHRTALALRLDLAVLLVLALIQFIRPLPREARPPKMF